MSMKTKIAAILRKAESTTHPEEAASLLAKAQSLMEEHQISFAKDEDLNDIDGKGSMKFEAFDTIRTSEFDKGTPAAVRYDLEAQVAIFFGCQVLRVGHGKRCRYDIHGAESALLVHTHMFPFIWKQVGSLASSAAPTTSAQRKLKRDISRALASRLHFLKETRKQEQQGTGTELVLVGLEEALKDFVKSQYDDIRPGKAPKTKAPSALAHLLAEKVRVDTPIERKEGAARASIK